MVIMILCIFYSVFGALKKYGSTVHSLPSNGHINEVNVMILNAPFKNVYKFKKLWIGIKKSAADRIRTCAGIAHWISSPTP